MGKQPNGSKEKREQKRFHLLVTETGSGRKRLDGEISRTNLVALAISACLAIALLIYLLTAFTPLRNTIPGYPSAETRRASVENLIKVDSLENVLESWAFQVENIQRIVTGQPPRDINTSASLTAFAEIDSGRRAVIAANDSLLREELRKQEALKPKTGLRGGPLEGMLLFPPMKGVVTHPFSAAKGEPYTNITSGEGAMVHAISEGTIILAGRNDRGLFNLVIQHDNDLISVYRNCDKLLHAAGTTVEAGTPVAIPGRQPDGYILHFEMWHRGEAVDPSLFITF